MGILYDFKTSWGGGGGVEGNGLSIGFPKLVRHKHSRLKGRLFNYFCLDL